MPRQTELSEEQKRLGTLVLRSLLQNAGEFIWQWHRPEDFKDVLSTESRGLRIELINYRVAGTGLLFLRYGGDCCGAISTEIAPEEERKMFFDLWKKTLLICKKQRNEAIQGALLLEQKETVGFKFTSDENEVTTPAHAG